MCPYRSIARALRVPALLAIAAIGSGCASVIPFLPSEVMTGITLTSYLSTGKGLTDHALDLATGQECDVLAAITGSEPTICTPRTTGLASAEPLPSTPRPRGGDSGVALRVSAELTPTSRRLLPS